MAFHLHSRAAQHLRQTDDLIGIGTRASAFRRLATAGIQGSSTRQQNRVRLSYTRLSTLCTPHLIVNQEQSINMRASPISPTSHHMWTSNACCLPGHTQRLQIRHLLRLLRDGRSRLPKSSQHRRPANVSPTLLLLIWTSALAGAPYEDIALGRPLLWNLLTSLSCAGRTKQRYAIAIHPQQLTDHSRTIGILRQICRQRQESLSAIQPDWRESRHCRYHVLQARLRRQSSKRSQWNAGGQTTNEGKTTSSVTYLHCT